MNWVRIAGTAFALAVVATPVAAQMVSSGFDGINFVKAVRDRDGAKALELMRARGTVILNARDDSGDTALLVAIERRDDEWTGFLLQEGADPNLAARNGDTPLIAAARVGFGAAVGELLRRNAKVDAANRMGETALIVAVQQRQASIVKALLALGADPDRTDSAQGYSARDYAKRDPRAREILALIEQAGKATPKSDKLEDFKL